MKITLGELELENKLKDFEETQEAKEAAAEENKKSLILAKSEISKLKNTNSQYSKEVAELKNTIKELQVGGGLTMAEDMMDMIDEMEGDEEEEDEEEM